MCVSHKALWVESYVINKVEVVEGQQIKATKPAKDPN